MPLLYAGQHTSLIQSLQLREYLAYSPLLQFCMFFSVSESIALVTSQLAVTMADDNSDNDNGPVRWERLSFTAKFLHNDIPYDKNSR